jgi:hypothetical protein
MGQLFDANILKSGSIEHAIQQISEKALFFGESVYYASTILIVKFYLDEAF